MQNLQQLLEFLVKSPLEFVLIGGFAAVLHGCNQTTRDIDVCLVLSPEQILLLREVLKPLNPRHRMTHAKLPFLQHPENLEKSKKSLGRHKDLVIVQELESIKSER